jgi:putative acetyltransferase
LVSITESQISGFLGLDPDGHLDCAYINPRFKRQGIMTRLVKRAIEAGFNSGINRVYVEASICARPLFEKIGFRTIRENWVKLGEIELLNYSMELLRTSV